MELEVVIFMREVLERKKKKRKTKVVSESDIQTD